MCDNEALKESKKALRKKVIESRNSMPEAERQSYSIKAVEKIIMSKEYRESDIVYAFASFGSEIDTELIIKDALQSNKVLALPRVEGTSMIFKRVTSMGDLEIRGKYGIREPKITADTVTGSGFMIVPGIVMSRDFYRIGYGAGFYDRYLGLHKNIFKAGLCFDIQLMDKVPHDDYDVRIDAIYTDKVELRR